MKIIIFVLFFLIVSALIFISNNNLKMVHSENIAKFENLYLNWLDNVYKNLQILTGEVVKMDWIPE